MDEEENAKTFSVAKRARMALLGLAFVCWIGYTLAPNLLGRRPSDPDDVRGFILPYDNHGHFFISQSDLEFIHGWLWATLGFVALAIIAGCFELWADPSKN
jgi:hypothetical protein